MVEQQSLALAELDRTRTLKHRIAVGERCVGMQLTSFDPAVAEILARAGFDWIVVDALGVADDLTSAEYLQAVGTVEAAARNNGKAMGMGMACYNGEEAARWADAGYRLVMMGDDVFLAARAREAMAAWQARV